MNQKYVTDVISTSYKEWKQGDTITIDAQTGTGKTHFIINSLVPYLVKQNKTLLYIHNRSALGGKILGQLIQYYKHGIHVVSYQQIQEELVKEEYGKNNRSYKDYDYTVFDECHYIMQDATFNSTVDVFYNKYFLNPNPDAINIFMSATIANVKELIYDYHGHTKNYTTGVKDYSYITPYYFENMKDIINTINNDSSGEKWLVFTSNIKKGKEYERLIDDSKLVFSKGYSASKPNRKLLDSIVENDKFDCKCLISTKVLDNGIDLKDDRLTNIVILATDKTDFLQMLGRKRIDINNPQKVNLYLSQCSAKTFQSRINGDIRSKNELLSLYRDDIDKFNMKYNTKLISIANHPSLFCKSNGEWKIIGLGLKMHKLNELYTHKYIKGIKKDPLYFINKQLSWIGLEYEPLKHIQAVLDNNDIINLTDYLDSLIDTDVFIDEQRILKTLVAQKVYNVDRNKLRYTKMHVKTFNSIIQNDLNLNYHAIAIRSNKRSDRVVNRYTYWKIIKTDET